MRRKYGLLMSFLLACSCFIVSAEAREREHDCATRPANCPEGLECRPIQCAERTIVAFERLGKGLVSLQADRPRWFRPFLEAGASWSIIDQRTDFRGAAGVNLWQRIETAVEISTDDVRIRTAYRREW